MSEYMGKFSYYMVMWEHAEIAWMLWMALSLAVTVYTAYRGALVELPIFGGPFLGAFMTILGFFWFFVGAVHGWLPRGL